MNILGIDYGQKRIGLSLAKSGLDLVLPYGQITIKNTEDALEKLQEIIEKNNIEKIVFGLPLSMDGSENDHTKRIQKIAKELETSTGIALDFVDERFTSRQADNTPGDVSRDEKAAIILLEAYLANT
jgi:putative holliday junction resolvase